MQTKRTLADIYWLREYDLYSMKAEELLSLWRFMTKLFDAEYRKPDEERNYWFTKRLWTIMHKIKFVLKRFEVDNLTRSTIINQVVKEVTESL